MRRDVSERALVKPTLEAGRLPFPVGESPFRIKGSGYLLRKTERQVARKQDASWAALMKHSVGLDVLGCPRAGCTGGLTLVAVIFDRDEVKRLLEHLRLFTEPIPLQSARDPPEHWTEA